MNRTGFTGYVVHPANLPAAGASPESQFKEHGGQILTAAAKAVAAAAIAFPGFVEFAPGAGQKHRNQ